MKVLALDPFHTGSHRAFLEGWARRSRHEFTCRTLPGRHWKWRMRQGAVAFRPEPADVVLTTDMLDVATFRGLTGCDLPIVTYFHENQLTYPDRRSLERDRHFAFTNLTTALASTEVWFNSAFHRDAFLGAIGPFLDAMPDRLEIDPSAIRSRVAHPGIDVIEGDIERGDVPRLAWVARWEHDKRPEVFFDAIRAIRDRCDVRLVVLGESYRTVPRAFEEARRDLGDLIDHWGFASSRAEYEGWLRRSDLVVSTAGHEFFGLAIMEGASAGAVPVLPRRLAYPELFDADARFYDRDDDLPGMLVDLVHERPTGDRSRAGRFDFSVRVPALDAMLEEAARR